MRFIEVRHLVAAAGALHFLAFVEGQITVTPTKNPTENPTETLTENPTLFPSIFHSSGPSLFPDCVSMIDLESGCVPWSQVVPGGLTQNETVTIECQVCVDMGEMTGGEVLDLRGGLDIVGRLQIPESSKLTIRTPYIFVQGQLYMNFTNTKLSGEPSVTILMVGTEDVYFRPHERNKVSLPSNPFKAGKKPILVAGGQVEIYGFPSSESADETYGWDRLAHIEREPVITGLLPKPDPLHSTLPQMVEHEEETDDNCDYNLLIMRTLMTGEDIEGITNFVDFSWPQFKCIIPDQVYFLVARMRVVPRDENIPTKCLSDRTGCPEIKFTKGSSLIDPPLAHMHAAEAEELVVMDHAWFVMKKTIVITSADLAAYDGFSFVTSDPNTWLLTKEILITLPPRQAYHPQRSHPGPFYPPHYDTCRNLVLNSGADESHGFAYPIVPNTVGDELSVLHDDNNPYFNTGNPYFRLSNRQHDFSTPTFEILPECLIEGAIYHFSVNLRIHSFEATEPKVMLKLTGSRIYYKQIVTCPPVDESMGWVYCAGDVEFDAVDAEATKIEFMIFTPFEKADVDYDDILLLFKNGYIQPPVPPPSCPDTLVSISDSNFVEFDDNFVRCIIPDQTYLFKSTISINAEGLPFGQTSDCSISGENCPRLSYTYTMANGTEVYMDSMIFMYTPEAADVVDGEYFTFEGFFAFNETVIENFEGLTFITKQEGVTVDVKSLEMFIVPEYAYSDSCVDLAINGDAERDTNPYPMLSSIHTAKLLVKKEEDTGNQYFHLGDRKMWWNSLTFDLTQNCLGWKSLYRFTGRVRILSDEPTRSAALLKTFNETGEFHFDMMQLCPESSVEIGWVDCTAEFLLDERHLLAHRVQFLIVPKDESMADMDFDDIKFEFISGSPVDLQFEPWVYDAWGPGARVVVASQTFNYDEEQILEISTVDSNGTVTFTEDFIIPPSLEEEPVFAGEFAVLDRNILFDAEQDDPDEPYDGGYLMIFKSKQGIEQHIEGVAFRHFGQMGRIGRNPIFIHKSYYLENSTFSHNVFEDNYHRCIVISKSNSALIKDNVAYNNAGACYVIQEKPSSFNNFTRNFGARTTTVLKDPIADWYEDTFPATYAFKDPNNYFEDNVAAGSIGVGFWFYLEWYDGDVLLLFDNNSAHSNHHNAIQTFPFGWDSSSDSVFSNTNVFRNRGIGWYCHYGHQFVVDGGVFADNRIGIDVNYCDGVTIQNVEMIGYTRAFERITEKYGLKHFCWNENAAVYGVRIHPNNKNTRYRGSSLNNIDFSRYQKHLGCLNNKAILMNDDRVLSVPEENQRIFNMTVDSKYVFNEISYDEPIGFPLHENVMDFCPLAATTVKDLYIADDGSLNPEQDGTAGFIVNDHEFMTMWAEKCTDLEGTCAKYCTGPGACMTKVTIGVDTQQSEHIKLHVFKKTHEAMRVVEGIAIHDFADFESRRFYWFYLPAGEYVGYFKQLGEYIWPTYAEIMIDHPHEPNCPGHVYNFSLYEPPVPAPYYCDSLAINGEMDAYGEIGSNRFYYMDKRGIKIVKPGADNSFKATMTQGRGKVESAIVHFVDTRCFKQEILEAGKRYTIEARVWMEHWCNPYTVKSGDNRCPRASMRSRRDGWDLDYDWLIGDTLAPFVANSWSNKLFGMFEMTQEMVDADNVGVFFEGPDPNRDFALDSVSIRAVVEQCDNLVFNWNLESGDHRYWKYTGDNTGLKMMANSKWFGQGWSISTVNRDEWWHGVAQDIKSTRCMRVGQVLEARLDYRLETEAGLNFVCDPFLAYSGMYNSCPKFGLRILHADGVSEDYVEIGGYRGPYKEQYWNQLEGYFVVTQEMMDAKRLDLYVSNAYPTINIIIDNVIVTENKNPSLLYGYVDCATTTDLVKNGRGQWRDARHWFIKGSGGWGSGNYGTVTMSSGQNGGYSFYHSGYTQHWQGLWQTLPQDCMAVGSKWRLTAYFQLYNEFNQHATCDSSLEYIGQGVTCPCFFFQSHTEGVGLYQTKKLLNENTNEWVKGSWNQYTAVFTMTEEHKAHDETWFFVHNAPVGYSYAVDNISLVPA